MQYVSHITLLKIMRGLSEQITTAFRGGKSAKGLKLMWISVKNISNIHDSQSEPANG